MGSSVDVPRLQQAAATDAEPALDVENAAPDEAAEPRGTTSSGATTGGASAPETPAPAASDAIR